MLHKLIFTLLFASLTCVQIASAGSTGEVKCYSMQFPNDYDLNRFEGVWFEYARSEDHLKGKMDCVICSYLIIQNDFGVGLSGIDFPNKTVSLVATGKILRSGAFFVTFNNNGPKRTGQIIGTDYTSWAVVVLCEEHQNMHTEMVVILTRERIPNKGTVKAAMTLLPATNFSEKDLYKTKQHNCPN